MKARTLIIAAAIISMPIAGGAVAKAGKSHHGQDRFAQIDVNGDGKITPAESQAHGAARFTKTDADNDGQLSPAEMKAAMLAKMSKRLDDRIAKQIKHADTDGDGMISSAEAAVVGDARFARMDANKDGVVEMSEIKKKRSHHRRHKGMEAPKQ